MSDEWADLLARLIYAHGPLAGHARFNHLADETDRDLTRWRNLGKRLDGTEKSPAK